ncbi:type II toxin-antitoxin system VapC family toxin [Mesorhizobium sp. CGMCC 1.15528]|uniref:Ribonuclease VapC n=1 Tax=Mesorhizobium zhangyense TaxID=1776730 RepID=A0A7C9VAC5_9HYPH|nr:type II toxin-antitoxin system VapC family toxin [Mesorhizobium zhangyense]NGN40071.1 type II toxin-antitoxin system VapC family toxin [Mesorhizobium zhangyense]
MLYVDTSVLVAALTKEARTDEIQSWLSQQDPNELAISDWVITEFSSALSIKLRTDQLLAEHRATALAAFVQLVSNSFNMLPVSGAQFRAAARFADQYMLGLRAGDALHLAVAADNGATVVTLDKRLAEAGLPLGVKTKLL